MNVRYSISVVYTEHRQKWHTRDDTLIPESEAS